MSLDISCGDFDTNITHNLNGMFSHAFGVDNYEAVLAFKKGGEVLHLIDMAIMNMVCSPSEYEKFEASNGWGTYEQALPWLIKLRQGLALNPDSEINLWG